MGIHQNKNAWINMSLKLKESFGVFNLSYYLQNYVLKAKIETVGFESTN